jgi:hypothetical protein
VTFLVLVAQSLLSAQWIEIYLLSTNSTNGEKHTSRKETNLKAWKVSSLH